jgi:glutathione S-transferase
MNTSLKLWGRISSVNVRKVMWTAQYLKLPIERVDAGGKFGLLDTPEYRRMNPNAMIPVLQDGDFTLWESNVIVRYLCAKHSFGHLALYPQDIRASFDAERWMDWQQSELNRATGPAFVQWFRTEPEQRNTAIIEDSTRKTERWLAILESHLQHHRYMAGDQLTMADIPILCEIHRWWALPQPRPSYPAIERWYAPLLAHEASKGVFDISMN